MGNGFLLGVGGVVMLGAIASGQTDAGASSTPAQAHKASMSVEYADTFQGIQALYAVRACSDEDRPRDSVGARPVIGSETKTATANDVIVRVIDRDGKEISRHVGAAAVCGFARLGAAFVVQANGNATGDRK